MTNWEPNQDELHQVLVLLHHSQSADTEVQRNVQLRLDELKNHPQFCCYLVYILSQLSDQQEASRSLAGLILKNNIRLQWKMYGRDVQDFVKQRTLMSIADPSALIRATVGIIITTVVMEEGVAGWPELLPTLKEMLSMDNANMQEGALGAIHKVFEDSGDRLENEQFEPLMIPLLSFFTSSNPKMRGMSMSCYNSILMVNNDPIAPVIDQFLQQLFTRAHDSDEEVQRQLCRSLCLLLDAFLEKLKPHLPNVIDYIIVKTNDTNANIAVEACEFFLSLSECPEICKPALEPVLDKVIPVLIRCMRHSEEDIIAMKGNCDEDDSMIPDRDEDIKPRFHKSKQITGTGSEEDEEDDDDGSTDWNIRRCSAASLDVLANIFKQNLLPILLPIIKETLTHPEWEVKESGILALGAIAEGCLEGIRPYLPELVPFLLTMLDDKKPLVRSITCWTLSRYCNWVVDEAKDQFFEQLLKGLLVRILDGNKRVQEAACSAFATFEEEGGEFFVPYLDDIVRTLVRAFGVYQAKNLLILYDAVGTLATSVGKSFAQTQYVQMIMPPLMDKWQRLKDEEKELFPLLECISAVASATGLEFLPYCEQVFVRCISLIERSIQQSLQAQQCPSQFEMPDKDFLIVALDLLSGLAEGLGNRIEPLVARGNIIQLMIASTMDITPEVRQSTFALLGDLVKTCWVQIKPYVTTMIPVMIVNFDPNHVSVCNNAIWAFGEIAIRFGPEMKQYATQVLRFLIEIVNKSDLQRTLLENTAITLGRLGIYCAEELSPHLNFFIRACCICLRNIRDNTEKESAFRGLVNMINLNPQGIVNDFIFWCDAIASWQPQNLKPDLKEAFARILQGFRNHMGDQSWQIFISQFPEPLRERLVAVYNI